LKIPIHQHSESVNLFNISKDGAAHIYLDGILYFVVLFNISKDGATHIYLDCILLYCSIYQKMADAPILRQPLCTLLYLLDIRIYDINRQLINVFHILLVLMDVTNDGSKHKLVYLVS